MGTLIENFCCINTNELLENTKVIKYSMLNNSKDKGSKEDSYGRESLPSSELKSLPVMDIKIDNQKTKKGKIKELSNLPISTKNIVRRVLGNPFDNYRLIKKLGNGTFGQVYKVSHKKTGNIRAMKIIPKNNLRSGFADKDIIREINIMKNLDHPHIIKIYEFYRDQNNYYLINEFCTEGDLSEKLIKLKHLPEPIVKILMAQIFSAVLYLNNSGIIHGDLKLENILVDSYLDDGNIHRKRSNFISSLIVDSKNVQNYLRNLNKRKLNTSVFNRKAIQQNLNSFKKKDRISNKFEPKNLFLNENSINIINEESRENEINNEERKNNYEPENNFTKETSDIFGFESHDEENDELNNSSESSGSFEIFNSKKKNDNIIETPKKIPHFHYDNNSEVKIYPRNSAQIKLGFGLEEEKNKINRKIEKKLTYNYNKLNIKNFELKLIDFGCSKIFSQQKKTTFEDTIGTLVYCSPEVLKNNYDQKCDIWSCGVIMYLLLCGKYPFSGKSEEEITKKILFDKLTFDDKLFENVSESAKDLIRKCLIRDKNKRISVKEALTHEFFAGEINMNNIFADEVETKNILKNLKTNARKTSKFYQIVLTYLSYNFADKEQLQRLRNIFYKIDLNMDGKLSKEELYKAYKDAGIKLTKTELNEIIKSMDFDGNGFIEYEEFIRVTLPKEQLFTDLNLKNAFDMFDKDKNGTISLNEIIEVIGTELDKKAIEELKKEVSLDGDKEIDFKHFKEFMLGLNSEND